MKDTPEVEKEEMRIAEEEMDDTHGHNSEGCYGQGTYLDKLLCKYLDRDGNGYVTLGNLATATIGIAALSIIGMSYVRGVTTIMEYWNGNVLNTLASAILDAGMIDSVCIPMAIVGTAFLLATVLSFTLEAMWIGLEAAWAVKMAKCERKDGDETL